MFFVPPSKLPARALAGMALASFAAVGVALVAQHQFGVKPCPWCVLQRAIFLVIGALSLLGWLVQATRPLRQAVVVLVLVLCAAGLTAAVFQHEVASQSATCAMGLAVPAALVSERGGGGGCGLGRCYVEPIGYRLVAVLGGDQDLGQPARVPDRC